MTRTGRFYVNVIPTDWLNQVKGEEAKAAVAPFARDKASAALPNGDMRSILFDPEANKFFVTEAYRKANPDVKLDKVLSEFTGKASANAVLQAQPEGFVVRERTPKIAAEDELAITVPRWKVENGQVVTDERGNPEPVGKGFAARMEEEFGAKAEFKSHVFNEATGAMGTWVVSKSEVAKHEGYRAFIGQFQTDEAVKNWGIAQNHDEKANRSVRNFVEISQRDLCDSRGKENLYAKFRTLDEPESFRRYAFALDRVGTGLTAQITAQERAYSRHVDQIAKKAPAYGPGETGPAERQFKVLNGAPVFTKAEQAEMAEHRIALKLDSPVRQSASDMTPSGKESRNPMNKGLIDQMKDVVTVGKQMEQIYATKAFPVPSLSEYVRNHDGQGHAQVQGGAAAAL